MITPVKFELAKTLKEKGFDKQCSNFYTNPRCKMFGIDEHGRYYPIKNKAKTLWISGNAATLDYKHVYYAPTITEVCMWLYEKHGIWVYAKRSFETINNEAFDKLTPVIEFIPQTQFDVDNMGNFNSPTEAYEVAIEYALNNLIK